MGDSEGVTPRTNVVLGIILLAACVLGWLAADGLPRGLAVDPIGPAYFPRFIIICIAVLAAALLVLSLRDVRRQRTAPRPEHPGPVSKAAEADLTTGTALEVMDEEELPPISYPRMISVLALSFVYVLLMNALGYFISTAVYVVALLLLLRVRNVPALAGCALGTPLLLQLLFQKLLGVPLPGGVLDLLPFTLPFS
jgi:hypothetical protein